MQQTNLKEFKIKLPIDVIESISDKEIVNLLINKALTKAEYYQSKSQEMEEKHGAGFETFKKKIDESEEEKIKEWDDLLLWEGYILGYKEWKKKYEGLRYCIE
ncbi:MAG: hypothetical protein V1872_10920 [bacterium]